MKLNDKVFSKKLAPTKSARMVESIFGCKWSLTVYHLLANDIKRPGEMVRSVEGLSTKVLNQCLKRNIDFGILKKITYNEIPPKVEYKVTEFGQEFIQVLESIQQLQNSLDSQK